MYKGIQDSVSFKMNIQKLIAFPYRCKKGKQEKVLKGNTGKELYNIGMKKFFLSRYKNQEGEVH